VTTATRIVFTGPGDVVLEDFELPDLGPEHVLVRTRHTMTSTGTEMTALHHRFDERSHWASYARYPFHPGYSLIGQIAEIGSEVNDLSVGDVVASRLGHASAHVHEGRLCTRVPSGFDLRDACWFALAKIALMGAQVSEHGLGSRVLVVGAGPVGQMSVRWANAAGAAYIVAVDPFGPRLELARRGGATGTIAESFGEGTRGAIVAACGGVRPEVVIDATGNAEVFAEALRTVADRGRVVVLGNTGMPAEQRLTDDVITRGLEIRGAHDILSMTGPDWDGDRGIHQMFFDLVHRGRFDVGGLITDTFDATSAPDAYRELDERRSEMLGVCFDW
jgi:2-desacetyl-2-hydroxyethyl bacteriochlorophyllide A dehydrogenase